MQIATCNSDFHDCKILQITGNCIINSIQLIFDKSSYETVQISKQKTLTHSQTTILDSSELKELADDKFKFDVNDRKFSKQVENTVGKGEIAHSNFYFSHSVFKRLALQI